MVEARLEASSPTVILKVEEKAGLRLEESTRVGTAVACNEHVESIQWRHLNFPNKECVIAQPHLRGCIAYNGEVYLVTPPS